MSLPIKCLDNHTAASIRGSQIIGSVSRAVEELILNAVQASASSISIQLGANNEITLTDDGTGIDAEAMRCYIGIEYCSNNNNGVGKGETLRSLASLCIEMKIESSNSHGYTDGSKSRAALTNINGLESLSTNNKQIIHCEKIFRNGHVVSFNQSSDSRGNSAIIPKINNTPKEMIRSGTIITLRGLFHQHAVRRKQYHQEKSSNSQELAQVRSAFRLLALCYPHVSFKLKDSSGEVDCSYNAKLPTASSAPSLRLQSRALILRLCKMYPNEFNEDRSIDLVSEESSFQAFGILCIVSDFDADEDDMLHHKELQIIAINGRLATQGDKLANVVQNQVRAARGNVSSE